VPRKTTADNVTTTAIARRTPARSSMSHVYPVSSKATQASASPLTTPALPLGQLAEAVADFEIGEKEAVNGHHDLRSGEAGNSLAGRRSLLPTSCLSKRTLPPHDDIGSVGGVKIAGLIVGQALGVGLAVRPETRGVRLFRARRSVILRSGGQMRTIRLRAISSTHLTGCRQVVPR
jgi:hypothetical protein